MDTIEQLQEKVRIYTLADSRKGVQISTATFFLRQALDCILTHCIPQEDTVLQERLLTFTKANY